MVMDGFFSFLSSILTASGLRNIAQFIERWLLGNWGGGRFNFCRY